MTDGIDFGYPWWLSYGHLVLAASSGLLVWLCLRSRWPTWLTACLGAVLVWSLAGFLIARFVLNVNGRASLPTAQFLRAGTGKVLDIGAGTGRSSIMVLEARPQTSLVALDLFGESFEHHFGTGQSPEARLNANLKAAHVQDRATIQAGDMRHLPFENATFDGIVSSFAIDHLNRQGSEQALGEAARVLKPNGEFLLSLVGKDIWTTLAFGPLLDHGGLRKPAWWEDRLRAVGFDIVENGTSRGALYFLARRRPIT